MRVGILDVDGSMIEAICRRYGIGRLESFGSAARNDLGADSDNDLLYEHAPGRQLGWEIADAEAALAEIFGRQVDLVSKRALNPRIRSEVLSEARPLYAA
jgi:predicted nucleotidyltransferase